MKLSIWSYGKEGAAASGVLAVVGTFLNWWLGGFDVMLQSLLFFMVMDIIVGIAAAYKDKKVNSNVMFWGGVNKFLVLGMVGIGMKLDILMGLENPYIRTAVIWFFIGRELLSIVENYGKLGMSLPPAIKNALEQIQEKGGK